MLDQLRLKVPQHLALPEAPERGAVLCRKNIPGAPELWSMSRWISYCCDGCGTCLRGARGYVKCRSPKKESEVLEDWYQFFKNEHKRRTHKALFWVVNLPLNTRRCRCEAELVVCRVAVLASMLHADSEVMMRNDHSPVLRGWVSSRWALRQGGDRNTPGTETFINREQGSGSGGYPPPCLGVEAFPLPSRIHDNINLLPLCRVKGCSDEMIHDVRDQRLECEGIARDREKIHKIDVLVVFDGEPGESRERGRR
jgi:hypothetical protein